MSFLCPSVGLLKLRRFTRTGLANPRSRGLRSNVSSRGTSVAFERAGSDVSIASQGGFSALYGEVYNPVSRNEENRAETSKELGENDGESFGGIYIGEGTGKSKFQNTVKNERNCQRAPDVEHLTQDPATAQSFTFFEETFESSQHPTSLTEDNLKTETGCYGAPNEQQTPLLSDSSLTSSSSSSRMRAHYNLPNWVRQRRCLPTLNEVDFDMIDAISLGGLSISSESDLLDGNNNNVPPERVSDKGLKVKAGSAKRTHSGDSYGNASQTQNPRLKNRQFLEREFSQGGTVSSVYSPKKTKRNDCVTTDDSEKQPLLQENLSHHPPSKLRSANSTEARKSPRTGSLRSRSKRRESFLRSKQPAGNHGNTKSKLSSNLSDRNPDKRNEPTDSEYIAKVGSLVRSKPLYMRATSEHALDPGAMKLRLESSTARKWRQTGARSPLSEVTNVSQPQASLCLRMEIVQRPVTRGQMCEEESPANPRKREPRQGSAKLPAGKIRPILKRSRSVYSGDGRGQMGSLRRRSREVKMDFPRTGNMSVKEETIDSLFRTNGTSNRGEFSIKENSSVAQSSERQQDQVQSQNQTDPSVSVINDELKKWTAPVAEEKEKDISKRECSTEDQVAITEADPQRQRQKHLIQKPKFADNSVEEARIVSTFKMAVDSVPEEANDAPVLPPKMLKSASFTAPSQSNGTDEDQMVSAKPTTRSATNVRALQTPLTQQQRRKVRRNPPGNRHGRGHRVSAVEASRQDIVEVVAAMKASLDSTKVTQGRESNRKATNFVKTALGEAVAMYDFEARTEDDVTVKIGDVVTVMNKDDPDWLFVKTHSGTQKEGFVPRIFLRLSTSEQESTKSGVPPKVIEKNSENSATEIAEQPLDTILEREKSQPACHKPAVSQSSNSHQQRVLPTTRTSQMLSSDQSAGQSSVVFVGDAGDRKTTNQSQSRLAEPLGLRHPPTSQSQLRHNDDTRAQRFNTNIRGGASAVLIETYVVVSDYTEQDKDEVSVVEGEVVVVNSGQQHEMDWMWVYVPRTERFGFVPAFSARPLGFHFSDV